MDRLRSLVRDIFTSGMYGKCEPAALYRFMMLNLILIVGTPFVLVFGITDIIRGIQPLGYIITFSGLLCVSTFTFLRKTKNYKFGSQFLVFILFLMFLYLLATGGSGDSGILWYYSFPLITLFLLGARRGSAVVLASLTVAAVILFWPDTPLLRAAYGREVRIRFIPSVLVLWAITSLFEYVMTAALKIEIKNNELRETVAELRQAREALSSEKERLAVTLGSIGDGVIATDMHGNVVLMNAVAERLTGWGQAEAAGRSIGGIVCVRDGKSNDLLGLQLGDVLQKGEIVAAGENMVFVDREGTERIISETAAPIYDTDRHIVGAVLVLRDVTERVRMEEDLHRTGKLESLGLLAGGLAHDFNNILTRIIGNAELAKMAFSEGRDSQEYMQRITQASRRATALTNQLLTFAKGGAPIIKSVNIANLIKETADFSLSGSPIKSEVSVPEDLWGVYADSGQVGQVISNLVINAAQASSHGGNIRVSAANFVEDGRTSALSEGRYVAISIQDDGTGIDPEDLEKIFDPYFTTKETGNGLGLTICHSIIRKHQGHISVSSSPGVGTTFTIYLPASFEEVRTETARRQVLPDSCRGKILVVDDEADLRMILITLLEHFGYEVFAVAEGGEALAAYKDAVSRSCPFDLVITDLTIPGGMGGKELAQKLLQFNPTARIVVSSGYSHDPIMAQFEKFGFVGIIEKPYELDGLGDTISGIMQGP